MGLSTREKRKELNDYCVHRGDSDQCDGCILNNPIFSCAFSSASDEEINKMYEQYLGGLNESHINSSNT